MFDAVSRVLLAEPRITYALVFGSTARGDARPQSDLDIAIGGLTAPMTPLELGDLIGQLEVVSGREVDLVLLDEAGPGLAYRVFRDGIGVLDREPIVLANRKARAMLEYADWKPVEDLFTGARGEPTGG